MENKVTFSNLSKLPGESFPWEWSSELRYDWAADNRRLLCLTQRGTVYAETPDNIFRSDGVRCFNMNVDGLTMLLNCLREMNFASNQKQK